MKFRNNLRDEYSPLYFLASLGSGGLVITFFMYLMFMTPHAGHPIPIFEDLYRTITATDIYSAILTIIAIIGIIWFTILHYRLLIWNIREYYIFKTTDKFRELKASNNEVQLMAIPLTYAMSINVLFILGALFVPSLWSKVEYLFPFSLIGFLLVGIYALVIFMEFFSRVISYGQFDCEKNNSLSQMLSIFAFSMVAVGLSAPGAMSHNQIVSGLGIILATAFTGIVVILFIIKIVLGFRAMFEHGINKEASVSLWIVIPILTVMGIALYRISMGLHHNFEMEAHTWSHVMLFTLIVALQIFFGLIGYRVMKLIGYYGEFISGDSRSVITYAAICPGVAFFVMGNFLMNKGLVAAGLFPKFSIIYFILYIPLVIIQAKTILALNHLNKKLLKRADN